MTPTMTVPPVSEAARAVRALPGSRREGASPRPRLRLHRNRSVVIPFAAYAQLIAERDRPSRREARASVLPWCRALQRRVRSRPRHSMTGSSPTTVHARTLADTAAGLMSERDPYVDPTTGVLRPLGITIPSAGDAERELTELSVYGSAAQASRPLRPRSPAVVPPSISRTSTRGRARTDRGDRRSNPSRSTAHSAYSDGLARLAADGTSAAAVPALIEGLASTCRGQRRAPLSRGQSAGRSAPSSPAARTPAGGSTGSAWTRAERNRLRGSIAAARVRWSPCSPAWSPEMVCRRSTWSAP